MKIGYCGPNTDGKPRLRINLPRKLIREHNLNAGDIIDIQINDVVRANLNKAEISEPLPETPALQEQAKKIIDPKPEEIDLDFPETEFLEQYKKMAERNDVYRAKHLLAKAKLEFGDEKTQLILKKGGFLDEVF